MQAEKVVSIKRVGKSKTLDIEVSNKEHIFYANGMATSNSHSIHYGRITYWTAYAKCHFPVDFYTATLSMCDRDSIPEFVNDSKSKGIKTVGPSIYKSDDSFSVDNMSIRYGLGNILRIGGSVLQQIRSVIAESESKLKKKIDKFSWTEIIFYLLLNIKKDAAMNLIDSGCFSHLGMYRQVQLYEFLQILELKLKDNEIEAIINKLPETVIDAVNIVEQVCTERRKTKVQSVKKLLINKPAVLKDSEEWINNTEEHLLSYPVTCLKLDASSIDTSAKNMSCKEFNLSQPTNNVILCCQVSRASEYSPPAGSLAGKTMMYVTVMDNTGSSECIAFPDAYKDYSSLLIKGNTIMVTGKKGNKGSLIIQKVGQL